MAAPALIRRLKRTELDGETFYPSDSGYDQYRRVWNATADRYPAVIIRAGSVSDVEKIVEIAAELEALLAVRGGGHSIPGLSTCDDGIVLDLSPMNQIHVDKTNKRAEVEGGSLLGDLDKSGEQAGLVVPAGVVSHTGVAGLTLGGGMGWLSRRFGLTIDSLVAVDLVMADGKSHRVNAELDPDLFWAIRGGGGNFGVVTKFYFDMHELGPVLIGSWTYPVADARNVLKRLNDTAKTAPREITAGFVFSPAELQVLAICTGPKAKDGDVMAAYGALGQVETASVGDMTFLELQQIFDEHMAWNHRYYMKGLFLEGLSTAAIDRMAESIVTAPSEDAHFYTIQLGGAVGDVGEESTSYSGRSAGYYCLMGAVWDDQKRDEEFISWSRETGTRLTDVAMSINYVNEQAEAGNEIARAAYGVEKYGRLAKLKARYDPANLFRLNQNIEPSA